MWLLYAIPVLAVINAYVNVELNEYDIKCDRLQRENVKLKQKIK